MKIEEFGSPRDDRKLWKYNINLSPLQKKKDLMTISQHFGATLDHSPHFSLPLPKSNQQTNLVDSSSCPSHGTKRVGLVNQTSVLYSVQERTLPLI